MGSFAPMTPSAVSPLDLASVRAQFPALRGERPPAFLDGPGGSQVPETVIEAIAACLRETNANLGGSFATSIEAVELVERGRAAAAEFTGSKPEEIAFGANMTTLNFQLAHAVARTLEPGDEIVVTGLDHDANVSPWLLVAADHDLVVRTAPLRLEDVTLDVDGLEALLGERTRVVAFTLASNAVGSITDCGAHRRGGAQRGSAGLGRRRPPRAAPPPRSRGLGLDVLLCSPYKFFGPHLGVAAIRRELAETLPADRVRPADDWPPGHRFEAGTQSHEAIAGMTAAIDYLRALGDGDLGRAYERIEAHEQALSRRFLEGLPATGCGCTGSPIPPRATERTPTFCLNLDGIEPRELAGLLAREDLYVWDGDYYALEPMRALGLGREGAVRIGFLHYTTPDEVDRVLAALERLSAGRGA